MSTLAEDYRIVDDPLTGERWVRYPTGEWARVDVSKLHEWVDDGKLATLDPATRVVVSYLIA